MDRGNDHAIRITSRATWPDWRFEELGLPAPTTEERIAAKLDMAWSLVQDAIDLGAFGAGDGCNVCEWSDRLRKCIYMAKVLGTDEALQG